MILVVGFFSFAVQASANEASTRDPGDARGPLDIKRIVYGHASGDVLWHKLVMDRRWGAKDLEGRSEIRFYFSTDGEDRYDEVHASVDLKDGKLAAWVYPYVEGSDYAGVGPSKRIRLTRSNRYSIKIFFNRSWVDRRDRYAWSAGSNYRDERCRRCDDYAPGYDPDRLVHSI